MGQGLSKREMNIAKRGKRGKRVSVLPIVRSNARHAQPGQPFAAKDYGSAVAGICDPAGTNERVAPIGRHRASKPRVTAKPAPKPVAKPITVEAPKKEFAKPAPIRMADFE
jgi:hypothetical protein